MSILLKHWKSSRELNKLIKKNDKKSNCINDLYWYDLNIKFAASFFGFIKILIWRIKKKLNYVFVKSKNNFNNKDAYNYTYQVQNPKNYGAETIYHSLVPKLAAAVSNPTIWNCKKINSSPWFKEDQWSKMIESKADIIRKEFYSVNVQSIIAKVHPGNKLLAEEGVWSSIVLIGPKGYNPEYFKFFPGTIKLLEKMPVCKNFGFVAFSKMSPRTHIKAHTGSSNVRLRYHLGIDIPEPGFVKIRVGNEKRPWIQDKVIIFDDSFEHEAFHKGTKDRVVLIIDLWHPRLSKNDIAILSSVEFKNFGKI